MKLKICIILTILLSANFGYAQPKLVTREELDKRQVKKFVDKFTKSFFEKKDFEAMPSKFFTEDFKTNINQSNNDFFIDEDSFKELSIDRQISYKLSILSLLNLLKIWSLSNKDFDLHKFDEMEDEEILSNTIPPEVLEILSKSRVFRTLVELEKKDDENPINSADLIEASEIMKIAIEMFIISIENRDANWRNYYSDNLNTSLKTTKIFDSYNVESCKNLECYGRPQKTKVFYQTLFPLCLHITRENGKLKIFDIHINIGD
jgi:hypothetical protein